MSDQKIIFSMVGVSKSHRPGQYVLKDIYLSFYYGAKIGVLGLNGAGKSTLLKIIAGEDEKYEGTIQADKNITFGYLHQEPELAAGKTVREIVEEGAAEAVGLMKDYEAVSAQFAEPDADFDVLMEKQAKLQEKIDHLNAWDIDSKLEMALDALRCPPATRPWTCSRAASAAASPSSDSSCKPPMSSCSTSPRTTSMPSPSPGSKATSNSTPARSSP